MLASLLHSSAGFRNHVPINLYRKRLICHLVTFHPLSSLPVQVSNITFQYGLDLAAWEDGLMESGDSPYTRGRLLNGQVYAYAWDNVWEWGVSNRAYKLANAGFKVCNQ